MTPTATAAPMLALLLCHCAAFAPQMGPMPTSSSAASAPSPPSEESQDPSRGSKPAAKRAEASKPLVPTTVEIHSDCSKTVGVFYGEKPKFGSGKKSSVSSNSTSSEGRGSDGTLMVWIIDDKENGVASVRVTPETKRVTIGASCKDVSAR